METLNSQPTKDTEHSREEIIAEALKTPENTVQLLMALLAEIDALKEQVSPKTANTMLEQIPLTVLENTQAPAKPIQKKSKNTSLSFRMGEFFGSKFK